MKCTSCQSYDEIDDPKTGDTLCASCGTVKLNTAYETELTF